MEAKESEKGWLDAAEKVLPRSAPPAKCSFCGSERLSSEVYDGKRHCLDCCNNTKV